MDIALLFNNGTSYTDIALAGPDLRINNDLETSVIVSLFSDAPAQPGDAVDSNYTGGWWGNTFLGDTTFVLGSRLWLLQRQKLTQAVANAAKQYGMEALQWMITEGIASSVVVQTQITPLFTLALGVAIYKPQVTPPEVYQWQNIWDQLLPNQSQSIVGSQI